MSFTADIYRKIQADIAQERSIPASQAMRKVTESNGIDIVFAVTVNSGMRVAYFSIAKDSVQRPFPKWKGINIHIVSLPAYGTTSLFLALTQLPLSEGYIFEIVVEDIRSDLAKASGLADSLERICRVLAKWKDFFQSDKELLLPPEKQQGLYGELLFLKECIEDMGTSSVLHWAGCNDETHDFYISSNAVEVKTTCKQAPYYAMISSEYQLDNDDVPGRLFLRFFALRKSQSSGQKLPELVSCIRELLASEHNMLQHFNVKVQKYGDWDEAEHYTTGYFIREEFVFSVEDGCPRIVKNDLLSGVADLSYTVSIAQCGPFAIEKTKVFSLLKGGAVDA